jgi:hypothetical protein
VAQAAGPLGTPDTPGWDLDDRGQVGDSLGQGSGLDTGEASTQLLGELGAGPRLPVEKYPTLVKQVLEVQGSNIFGEAGGSEDTLQHGTREWMDPEGVLGGEEMDRPSHELAPDDLSLAGHSRQLSGLEILQPGPQPEVGVERVLSLHSDQMLDQMLDGKIGSFEQVLTFQRGAVHLLRGEDVCRHGLTVRGTGAGL